MKISRTYIYLLIIVIFLTVVVISAIYSGQRKVGIGIVNDYFTGLDIEESSFDDDFTLYKGHKGEDQIKIKVIRGISSEQADGYVSDNDFALESRFRVVDSPYPGQISNKIACDGEYLPRRVSSEPYDYFIVYASERLTYGACSPDLVRYRSIIYYQYCSDTRELYHIELFIPISNFNSGYEDMLKNTRCEVEKA